MSANYPTPHNIKNYHEFTSPFGEDQKYETTIIPRNESDKIHHKSDNIKGEYQDVSSTNLSGTNPGVIQIVKKFMPNSEFSNPVMSTTFGNTGNDSANEEIVVKCKENAVSSASEFLNKDDYKNDYKDDYKDDYKNDYKEDYKEDYKKTEETQEIDVDVKQEVTSSC